ncbi:hypothetical protein CSC67_07870 [Pusillimonas caeni]|uniref:type IV secretion system protein VirB3 n=1 Tax=Pusillimonas caeni TaxID=1348472 RepID=UPI000E59937A|nr:VirB3 family type IV secretion system protein [Pusillimonas caeni]TFL14075.1 hypothetical protein CSC67_07870 [Pusillimonas caeni]
MKRAATPQGQPTPPAKERTIDPNHVPLFKGATRVATVKGGVPVRAFIFMVVGVGWLAMFNFYWLGLVAVLYPIMAIISRNDDRAFWVLELWVRTKLFARNKHYWNAISFTPTPYQRRRAWCRNEDS